jgi:hypothetical protein
VKNLGRAVDLLLLAAVPAIFAWGIADILSGRTGLGALLIFIACAGLWGIGGTVLQSWRRYEPGRYYVLFGVFVFGVMGGVALENAITGDHPIGIAVNALGAGILLYLALLMLYVWIKAVLGGQTGHDR